MTDRRVIFDHGPHAGPAQFRAARRVISAHRPEDVPAAMAALEQAQAEGFWLAGFASYELGYVYSSKLRDLMPAARQAPLLQFGVFEGPEPYAFEEGAAAAGLSELRPEWSEPYYMRAFAALHALICAGDIYQGNLTFALRGAWHGSLPALYARLRARQAAPHGAYVDLGGDVLLSRSPELFFAVDAARRMVTRPMKGTAPRGGDAAADAAEIAWLKGSEKNRAENLMIVDLLRNDMSRVSKIGSVKVPDLFTVESYETLHQMTSTVTSELLDGVGIGEVFAALFPCGSITGAPKIRAMQVLRDLETGARDAYCGAIGWIAPDGAMQFNVAIRTLICGADGSVRLNVGGGIVYDSAPQDEYREALLKGRFAALE